jgi:hypothetical protein
MMLLLIRLIRKHVWLLTLACMLPAAADLCNRMRMRLSHQCVNLLL